MHILIIQNSKKNQTSPLIYTEAHLQQIKKIDPDAQIDVIPSEKKLVDTYLPSVDILLYSSFDNTDLIDYEKAVNLKWVQVTSAGVQDIAPVLKNSPIMLANASGVHPIPIAEHVFGFMILLARGMHTSYRTQVTEKKWIQHTPQTLSLSELYGGTIGIIGFGRIGKRIAKVSKGFDMRVLALVQSKKTETEHVDAFYPIEDLGTLLKNSDFVVNCLPFTPRTENFFTMQKFKLMRPTAYFINIGRGQTVIEEDLIEALKNGVIAGAGLDVFEHEPLPEASPLWSMENVIITPHYAGWTPKYADRVIQIFCDNLEAYLQDAKMPNLVNKNEGY